MASSSDWFESVAEAQRRAKRRLPSSVFAALHAGAERGHSLDDNLTAFGELGLVPRIAAGVPQQRTFATSVMGVEQAMPVFISPTGVQAVHPEAELAVARAAAAAGVAMSLSSFASRPIEEIVAANPATFFQAYWLGGRERTGQILDRAQRAGAAGLIVTLDWSFAHRRDWGSPEIPERMALRTMARLAPQALSRPRWLLNFLRTGKLPTLTAPNLSREGASAPTFFEAYGEWMQTPLPTWDDIAWMRERWDGPFLVKGVLHPDDAVRAVEAGADAMSVSNHGGNNLDSTPAPIRMLSRIRDVVGDNTELVLDGGIRRGSDAVKALCLGARAVMIGRPYLWGLAAGGQAGVANVLEIMRAGIDETLIGLGKAGIEELREIDLLVPEHFCPLPPAVQES